MPEKNSATQIVQSLTAFLTPVRSRQQCFVKECRKLQVAAKNYQRLTNRLKLLLFNAPLNWLLRDVSRQLFGHRAFGNRRSYCIYVTSNKNEVLFLKVLVYPRQASHMCEEHSQLIRTSAFHHL